MPIPDERLPIRRALVLRRDNPDRGVTCFHSVLSVRDLFDTIQLGRNRGRIGTNGRELADVFANELEAGAALEALDRAKRRRGYQDL